MASNKKLKIGIQTYTCQGVYLNGRKLTEPTGIYLDGVKTLFWEPEPQAFYFVAQPNESYLPADASSNPVAGYLANAAYNTNFEASPQNWCYTQHF